MYNYEIKLVDISQIQAGDTVEIDGQLKTVCKNNITKGFCGVAIFGDTYRLGYEKVRKVIFKSFAKNS